MTIKSEESVLNAVELIDKNARRITALALVSQESGIEGLSPDVINDFFSLLSDLSTDISTIATSTVFYMDNRA